MLWQMVVDVQGHANFQEYVPLFLTLLGLLEMQKVMPVYMLHAVSLLCLVGRVLHAHNMCYRGPHHYRVYGMAITVGALTIEASALLLHSLIF